jgi:general secretion pathway protein C
MVNRYFTLANLLLVTFAVYFGVSIFYALLTSRLQGGPPVLPAGRSETAVGEAFVSKLADYQAIVERNLFNSGRQALGDAEKTAGTALDVDKLKQTELKVKLLGTTDGLGGEGLFSAQIEDPKTREHMIYRAGDRLQDRSIEQIQRGKVVLKDKDGKYEVLVQEPYGFTKSAAPGAVRADAGAAPRPPAPEPIQQVTVKEEQIEKAMESLSDLMSQATFRPHLEDGQPAGISITGIKPNAVFRKLRLRNGDVITGVNDQSIASVEDAMKVFGTLSTEAPIQVKIKRRGREETLEYKIE